MKKENDIVLINGKEYVLDSRLGGGTEGTVFSVKGFPKHVIKIINDEKFTNSQRNEVYNRLCWLKELGERNKNIRQLMTIPKALLDDELGYIMLKANEHEKLDAYIPGNIPTDFDAWYKDQYTLKKRYQIIVNLFRALREIHISGLIFTDLSPNNIMVHKTQNQIVFIDTDNTRRRTDAYLSVLGTTGFMAPELYRKANVEFAVKNNIDPSILSNSGRITVESDIFSAAIIAFELLTLQHPFIGDEIDEGGPEDEERALKIETDFIFKENTSNTSTCGLTIKYEELTTPEIRKLFYRTFVSGKDNPALRPTDEEFLEAFQNALDLIVECPDCGFSRIYHVSDSNECINCGSVFEEKVILVMYNVFKSIDRAEAINSIGDYSKYDVSLFNLTDSLGNTPKNYLEICRIVLEPGEKNQKFLYLRHFEETNERSEKYARLVLSESSQKLSIEILNNSFENPALIEKQTMKLLPLNNGKEFPLDKYGIIFDTKKLGKGYLQIFCKFIRG